MKKLFLSLAVLMVSVCGSARALSRVDVSVPSFSRIDQTLDGLASEEFWQNAAVLRDFRIFRKPDAPKVKTEIRLCRDSRNLYLWMNFDEPAGVNPGQGGTSPWSGDCVEIFFGNLAPVDWYRQIVIGANGLTYDEFILPGEYEFKIHREEKKWCLEVVFPFDKLGALDQNSLKFNILRQSNTEKKLMTWQDVRWGHEVDQFGTLLFYTPQKEVTHGPWIYGLTSRSAGVNWESAGMDGGELFYRRKGTDGFRRVLANVRGDKQSRRHVLHPVMLTGLLPDTEYEYHVGDRIVRSFRTRSEVSGDFSFVVVADIHARPKFLRQMLARPYSQKSEMAFLLGDLVTGMSGRGICYDCYLDQLCSEWKKAFYCIRGNHEYRGGGTEAFFDLFPVDGGKSYFMFSHKGVCFVMLDTDGDDNLKDEYFREQSAWLKKAVVSEEFRKADFRVLMAHAPLYERRQGGGAQILEMFGALPATAQQSFDLMLAGHLHAYCRLLPGDRKLHSNSPHYHQSAPVKQWKFPVLVVDYDGSLWVDKSDRRLEVRAYAAGGAKEIDRIQIVRK